MNLTFYQNMIQGSAEWHAARCGMITASRIGKLVKKNGEFSDLEGANSLINELALQRLTGCWDDTPTTFAMVRGRDDEAVARTLYSEKIKPVTKIGFITSEFDGVTLGYSPDGLVGDEGLIEVKSRAQKFQLDTIIKLAIPDKYKAQIQAGLMISGRKWCDFISFPACGGGKMFVMRAQADKAFQENLIAAVLEAEVRISSRMALYKDALNNRNARFFETRRRDYANQAEREFAE